MTTTIDNIDSGKRKAEEYQEAFVSGFMDSLVGRPRTKRMLCTEIKRLEAELNFVSEVAKSDNIGLRHALEYSDALKADAEALKAENDALKRELEVLIGRE